MWGAARRGRLHSDGSSLRQCAQAVQPELAEPQDKWVVSRPVPHTFSKACKPIDCWHCSQRSAVCILCIPAMLGISPGGHAESGLSGGRGGT